MISTVYWEWEFLIKSIRMGISLGILYDIITVFRMIIPHSRWLSGLEDALYWIVATPMIFFLLQQESQGIFRGFSMAGILFSLLLYHKLIAKLWISWLERGIAVIKRQLTKWKKVLRIEERVHRRILKFHRRNHGKEKNPGSEEKAKSTGNRSGYDGGSCDDACSSGK